MGPPHHVPTDDDLELPGKAHAVEGGDDIFRGGGGHHPGADPLPVQLLQPLPQARLRGQGAVLVGVAQALPHLGQLLPGDGRVRPLEEAVQGPGPRWCR